MLNLGCFSCPAKCCNAAQYRDSKCIELRSRLGEDDPGASTPYNLLYDEVLCTEVNWEQQLFRFKFNGREIIYKQPHYVDASADTDHIRCVISMFLDEHKNQLIQEEKGKAREQEDAEAILRIFPYADRSTKVWRDKDGTLSIGVYGCWNEKLNPSVFPSLQPESSTTLGDLCNADGHSTESGQKCEKYIIIREAFFADSSKSEVTAVDEVFNSYDAALAACEQLCKSECDELNETPAETDTEECDYLPDGFRWDEDLLDEDGNGKQKYDAVVRLWIGDDDTLVTGYMIRPFQFM